MTEFIERLAKVLYERKCAEVAADPTAPFRGPFGTFEELLKAKDYYLDEARAIVDAMRKPTINMVAAGQKVVWQGGARPGPVTVQVTTGTFGQIFEAMIDESLRT